MRMSRGKTVIVGGGKMGEAILAGWLASDAPPADELSPSSFAVVEPSADRRSFLEAEYGVLCAESAGELDAAVAGVPLEMVVLAVKPQVMMEVLESISSLPAFSAGAAGPLFVSIAAGLPTTRIGTALAQGTPLVRVMPNMPLMVASGASGVCGGQNADEGQVRFVASLFGCLGRAVVVDEAQMDAVCALSGSGPAYVAALIEAMRDAGVACGLGFELAETLALQTVLGTARLIDETDLTPGAAREAVCSPGGTTLAALEAMRQEGFSQAVHAGIAAARRRSEELANGR